MTGTDDAKAIEGVIQSYLDGLHEGDADKIAIAFHLTSVADNGELTITPRDVWLNNVRNSPSPKQRGLPRHDQVQSIDLVSPTMAYVKLKCDSAALLHRPALALEDRRPLADRAKGFYDRNAGMIGCGRVAT